MKKLSQEDKFWSKVAFRDNGCWEWRGKLCRGGYGQFKVNGSWTGAHRFAYQLHHNTTIPSGLQLDHLCRNRVCVNPAHLEAVTQRENITRGKRSALKSGKSSPYPGVHWYKPSEKWVAYIWIGGKLRYLGYYSKPEEAALRYRRLANCMNKLETHAMRISQAELAAALD